MSYHYFEILNYCHVYVTNTLMPYHCIYLAVCLCFGRTRKFENKIFDILGLKNGISGFTIKISTKANPFPFCQRLSSWMKFPILLT